MTDAEREEWFAKYEEEVKQRIALLTQSEIDVLIKQGVQNQIDLEKKIKKLTPGERSMIIEEEGYLSETAVDLFIALRDSGQLGSPIDPTEDADYPDTLN